MFGNNFDFRVEDGDVLVSNFSQWECRGDCSLEMLRMLVAGRPEFFEGRKGCVYYGDYPPPSEFARNDLNFCSTVRANFPAPWIPFPCFTSLRWPQIGVTDGVALLEELLTDERAWESPEIFWIGTDQHSSRRALRDLATHHPQILDVELMEWDRSNQHSLVSKSRQVSIGDHRNFKYLADCQGNGYSARLKWLIASGRPVFVVARNIVESWQMEMIPWVHFIPVAADLSDLLKHHARLESDPELYREIAGNARAFAATRLRLREQLAHVTDGVEETIEALGFPPSLHPAPTKRLDITRKSEGMDWLLGVTAGKGLLNSENIDWRTSKKIPAHPANGENPT